MTPGKKGKVTEEEMSLVEVGPRVCLQPIKIFAGSFGGPVLYENPSYVSPNKVSSRSMPGACILHVERWRTLDFIICKREIPCTVGDSFVACVLAFVW